MESVITQKEHTPVDKRAVFLLAAAGATLVVIFGVNLLHLLDNVIFRALHFTAYSLMIYNAAAAVVFFIYIPCLNAFLVRKTGFAPFARSDKPQPLSRTLILFGMAAVCVFVTAATLGFKFKLYYELGQDVAVLQMAATLVEYVRRLTQLLLAVVFMRIVDEAWTLLRPESKVPAAGIAFVLLYGVVEFFFYRSFGRNMFPYVYLAYNVVYAVMYYVGGRKVYTTFIPAAVLLVL